MAKMALVVNKEDVLAIDYTSLTSEVRIIDKYRMEGDCVLDLGFTLVDRANCETDLSLLQLLPYITLIDANTNKVFTYKRGGAGNEERLEGKYSIGLGGHIEEAPGSFSNIDDVIAMNVMRELNEEVGLDYTAHFYGRIVDALAKDKYRIMYAPDEEVGKYHLCFWMIFYISKDDFGNHEENIITEGNWLTIEELTELNMSQVASLEGWSKHCLTMLKQIRELEKEI